MLGFSSFSPNGGFFLPLILPTSTEIRLRVELSPKRHTKCCLEKDSALNGLKMIIAYLELLLITPKN